MHLNVRRLQFTGSAILFSLIVRMLYSVQGGEYISDWGQHELFHADWVKTGGGYLWSRAAIGLKMIFRLRGPIDPIWEA